MDAERPDEIEALIVRFLKDRCWCTDCKPDGEALAALARRLRQERDEALQYRDAIQHPDELVRTLRRNLDRTVVMLKQVEAERDEARRLYEGVYNEARSENTGGIWPIRKTLAIVTPPWHEEGK